MLFRHISLKWFKMINWPKAVCCVFQNFTIIIVVLLLLADLFWFIFFFPLILDEEQDFCNAANANTNDVTAFMGLVLVLWFMDLKNKLDFMTVCGIFMTF